MENTKINLDNVEVGHCIKFADGRYEKRVCFSGSYQEAREYLNKTGGASCGFDGNTVVTYGLLGDAAFYDETTGEILPF